jgi:putative Holliday junction resolvase
MILSNFKDFPATGRIMGIDWGARRMGIALSTPDRGFVFVWPQLTINNEQLTINKLVEIIENERIVGIVLGLPLHADGTDSNTTKKVREFANVLATETDVSIVFIEENLTSIEAEERHRAEGIRHNKFNIDSESAKIILENAISMMNRE